MVRLTCQSCGRPADVPDVLARVPLLCKACGGRMAAGAKKPPPKPESERESHDAGDELDTREDQDDEDDQPLTLQPPADEDEPAGESDGEEAPDDEPDPGEEPPEPDEPPLFLSNDVRGEVEGKKPAAPPPPAPQPAPVERRAFGVVVDVGVALALAGLGVLLGEFAAGKGTAAILTEAGSAPKFPPTDLLLWLGCAATPLLVYGLLANRGHTVGGWLRRR